jgi:hypothetical protein
MLIIDNLLLFPIRSLVLVLREIHQAVERECESEGDAVRTELREMYMRLEAKQITEQEFDAAETELLDRLDRLEARDAGANDGADTDV